jgi:hypothetical protein
MTWILFLLDTMAVLNTDFPCMCVFAVIANDSAPLFV